MASTKNCVICFKKAVSFGGHVHLGEETIIAGTCEEHFKSRADHKQLNGTKDCKGCFGIWKPEMEVDKTFGQFGYIDNKGFHPLD